MASTTYAATTRYSSEGVTVTIVGIRSGGHAIRGHGHTKDAAAIDAKRKLAEHLGKGRSISEISLVLDGGHS